MKITFLLEEAALWVETFEIRLSLGREIKKVRDRIEKDNHE